MLLYRYLVLSGDIFGYYSWGQGGYGQVVGRNQGLLSAYEVEDSPDSRITWLKISIVSRLENTWFMLSQLINFPLKISNLFNCIPRFMLIYILWLINVHWLKVNPTNVFQIFRVKCSKWFLKFVLSSNTNRIYLFRKFRLEEILEPHNKVK